MSSNGIPPAGWHQYRISEVADVRFSSVDKNIHAGQRTVRLCNYMDVWKNPYIHRDLRFMEGTATDAEIEKFSLRVDDVLITKDSETRNEIAEPSVVHERIENLVLGYHLALIRPNESLVSGPFLAAQLRIPQFRRQFINGASGVTRYGLGLDMVKNAIVWLPKTSVQVQIASIIRSIDEAIDVTGEVIEQTRRLLFALIEGVFTNGPTSRRSSQQTLAKFGNVPSAWTTDRMDSICSRITYGFTNPMPTTLDGPWMLTAESVGDGYIDFGKARHTDRETFIELLTAKSRPSLGDVLLTKDGTLGRVALVDCEDLCVNQSVAVLSPNRQLVSSRYLYWLLRSPQMQSAMMKDSSGSGLQHLYITKVAKLVIPVPNATIQAQMDAVLTSVQDRLELEEAKVRSLIAVKSALSQGLLTGKIPISSPSAKLAVAQGRDARKP